MKWKHSMSLENVIRYINGKTDYGTENFCYFLYSLVKMEQPDTVIELGVGEGVSTCMMAQALKENGKGVVGGIDNGRDWKLDGSYENFVNKLLINFFQLIAFMISASPLSLVTVYSYLTYSPFLLMYATLHQLY